MVTLTQRGHVYKLEGVGSTSRANGSARDYLNEGKQKEVWASKHVEWAVRPFGHHIVSCFSRFKV